MVNPTERSISKHNRGISNSIRSANTQIDTKLPRITSESIYLHKPMEEGRISKTFARNKGSRREDSYIFDLQNGSEQETPRKLRCRLGLLLAGKTAT